MIIDGIAIILLLHWYISGCPDSRWNDDELNTLKNVKGSAFEVVWMKQIVTALDEAP